MDSFPHYTNKQILYNIENIFPPFNSNNNVDDLPSSIGGNFSNIIIPNINTGKPNIERDVCECGLVPEPPARRITCIDGTPCNDYVSTQKKIWKQVRGSSSRYTSNKAGLFCFQKPSPVYCNVNWNQMSDRAKPSITYRNVPSRGNSTKCSLTRCRPGSSSAKGLGVDVKHGSYERYLLRKKGACPLKTQIPNEQTIPYQGNKVNKIEMAYSETCIY